jgi:hypothetical protein
MYITELEVRNSAIGGSKEGSVSPQEGHNWIQKQKIRPNETTREAKDALIRKKNSIYNYGQSTVEHNKRSGNDLPRGERKWIQIQKKQHNEKPNKIKDHCAILPRIYNRFDVLKNLNETMESTVLINETTPKSSETNNKSDKDTVSIVRGKSIVKHIPVIMNGEIIVNNNKQTDKKYNEYTENSMKEKEKSMRHRVLLLGDSQTRGCADLLKLNLNSEFDVSGLVKPGAKSSDILGININKGMSKDNIVIICAGSNDISKNNAKEGLKSITNFVKEPVTPTS